MDDDRARTAGPEGKGTTADAGGSVAPKIVLLIVFAISVWHIGAVVVWMSPQSFVRDRLARVSRKYVRLTKSDQSWAMFAPEPLTINRRVIVRAEMDEGEPREIDLTTPVNRAMRSLSFQRVGKTLKAHDRVLSGDEPLYLRGFALHTCADLSSRWGAHVRSVTLFREYQVLAVDTSSFRTTRSAPDRANLGSYVCFD